MCVERGTLPTARSGSGSKRPGQSTFRAGCNVANSCERNALPSAEIQVRTCRGVEVSRGARVCTANEFVQTWFPCARCCCVTCMDRRFPAGLGSINFDNIINAVLTIFQMMTLEGWADLCYSIQDSVGMAHWMYFVVLILIGPYLSVQLFLVVLSANCSSMASEHVSYDVQQ